MNEKYISIEFSQWENYYRPLSENYTKLSNQLETERADAFNLYVKDKVITEKDGWTILSKTTRVNAVTNSYGYMRSQEVYINIPEFIDELVNEKAKKKVESIPKWIRRIFGIN